MSRAQVCCNKAVLKNFAIFTGRHLCLGVPLLKKPEALLKKRLTQVFFYELCQIFKNNLFYRTHEMAACFRTKIFYFLG